MNNIQKAFKAKAQLGLRAAQGRQVQHMADGGGGLRQQGLVQGPGTGTSDSVPAMISKGEYVLPADTVAALGKDKLDAIKDATHTPVNNGLRGAHFDNGGMPAGPAEQGLAGQPNPNYLGGGGASTQVSPTPGMGARQNFTFGNNNAPGPAPASTALAPLSPLRSVPPQGPAPEYTDYKNVPPAPGPADPRVAAARAADSANFASQQRGAFSSPPPKPGFTPSGNGAAYDMGARARAFVQPLVKRMGGLPTKLNMAGNAATAGFNIAPNYHPITDENNGLSTGDKAQLLIDSGLRSASQIAGAGVGAAALGGLAAPTGPGAIVAGIAGGVGGGYLAGQGYDKLAGGLRSGANAVNSALGGSPNYWESSADIRAKHGYAANPDLMQTLHGNPLLAQGARSPTPAPALNGATPTTTLPSAVAAPAQSAAQPTAPVAPPAAPVIPTIVGKDGMATQNGNPVAGYGSITNSQGVRRSFAPGPEDDQGGASQANPAAYAPADYSGRQNSPADYHTQDLASGARGGAGAGGAGGNSFIGQIQANGAQRMADRSRGLDIAQQGQMMQAQNAHDANVVGDNSSIRSTEASMYGHNLSAQIAGRQMQWDRIKHSDEMGNSQRDYNLRADQYGHTQDEDARNASIKGTEALHQQILGQLPPGADGKPDAAGAAVYMAGAQQAVAKQAARLRAAGKEKDAASAEAIGPGGLSTTAKQELMTGTRIKTRFDQRMGENLSGVTGHVSSDPTDYMFSHVNPDDKTKAILRNGNSMDLNDLTHRDMTSRLGLPNPYNPLTSDLVGDLASPNANGARAPR